MNEPDNYNKEELYDTAISLAQPLIEFCKEHDLPLLVTICYGRDKEGSYHGMMGCSGPEGWYPPEYCMSRDIIRGKAIPVPVEMPTMQKLFEQLRTDLEEKKTLEKGP